METKRHSMGKRISDTHILILVILLSIVPKVIYALRVYPFYVMGDEIWTLASGAKLAGFDWSGILSGGRYYGMGFFALLAPLFNIIDDSLVLYRVFVVICAVINVAIPLMTYYIVKNILNITSKTMKLVLPVIASYLIYFPITMVYNEHIYVVLSCVVVFLLLLLSMNDISKRRKIIYTILLVATMGYSLTIHTRAITLWIGAAAVIIMYRIYTKEWLVHLKSFILTCIISYAGFSLLVKNQIDWLWQKTAGQIGNTSVYRGGLTSLADMSFWKSPISTVIGQLMAGNVATGGLLIPLVIIMFILLGKGLASIKRKEAVTIPKYLIITGVFAIVCCLVTIGGQAISDGEWVRSLLEGVQGTTDASRVLTYLRYYFAYIPIFLITGYVYIYRNSKVIKRYLSPIIIINVSVLVVWLAYILPFIKNYLPASTPYFAFSLYGIHADTAGVFTYLPAVVIMIVLMTAAYILLKKKRMRILAVIFLVFTIYRYGYYAEYTIIAEQNRYESTSTVRNVIEKYNLKDAMPDTIYVLGTDEFIQGIQFYLNDITVSIEPLTPVDKNNIVLITDYWASTDDYGIYADIQIYEIDDEHYIYTNNSNVIQILEKNNLEHIKD